MNKKCIRNNDDKLIAIILNKEGVEDNSIKFFTEDNGILQVAYAKHSQGTTVDAHIHKNIKRLVYNTEEVLIVTKGKIRVDFYTEKQEYIKSTIVKEGESIVFIECGHGIKQLEDSEFWEVKQGPYYKEEDKLKFSTIADDKVLYDE
jgi:hypothetical protein